MQQLVVSIVCMKLMIVPCWGHLSSVDQEKINRQLEQVVKALDSGDIAAAVEYLKETVKGYQREN
jgi:hypothetical protein